MHKLAGNIQRIMDFFNIPTYTYLELHNIPSLLHFNIRFRLSQNVFCNLIQMHISGTHNLTFIQIHFDDMIQMELDK